MTDENKKAAIAEELARAGEALRASELLAQHGLVSDAVSRLYYHALYHVRAALLALDLEPRSHQGALRLFSLHWVKTGLLPAEDAHLFSRLMKYREEADYNPAHPFRPEDLAVMLSEARDLAGRILAALRQRGLA